MEVLLFIVEVIEVLFLFGLNVDDLIKEIVLDALHVRFDIIELIDDIGIPALIESSPAAFEHIVVLFEVAGMMFHGFEDLRLVANVNLAQFELINEHTKKLLVL